MRRLGVQARGCLAGAALAALVAAAPAPAAKRIHVDCEADTAGGGGSPARPLSSLEAASRRVLGPGDRLVFARDSTCRGTLAPNGGGTRRRPAVIGAYGLGAPPRIDAAGSEQAVLLANLDHITVQDLHLTAPGDGTARRRGIHVVARGEGAPEVVRGIRVRFLRIDDVGGDLAKDGNGSGGVQFTAEGVPGTRFERVRIAANEITEVSRSGIFFVGTSDPNRPRASEPWPEASHDVVIRGNRIAGIAGDGIVPLGTDGAIVEDNVVSDGNRAGRSPSDPDGMICNAGIWAFHANNTLIQRNEVFDFSFNGCDGTAYDIDYDQDGTTVQYNLSHRNEGGFMLLCLDTRPRTAEIRFNLSVEDSWTFQQSPCELPAGFGGTLSGLRAYNNTFVSPRHGIQTALDERVPFLGNPGTFEFRNNVLVATEGQTEPVGFGDRSSHNLFFGLPASGTDAVVGDPLFVDPGRGGGGLRQLADGFRLRPGSPAIGAGVAVPKSPRRDYFGARVPDPPTIGFAQQ